MSFTFNGYFLAFLPKVTYKTIKSDKTLLLILALLNSIYIYQYFYHLEVYASCLWRDHICVILRCSQHNKQQCFNCQDLSKKKNVLWTKFRDESLTLKDKEGIIRTASPFTSTQAGIDNQLPNYASWSNCRYLLQASQTLPFLSACLFRQPLTWLALEYHVKHKQYVTEKVGWQTILMEVLWPFPLHNSLKWNSKCLS